MPDLIAEALLAEVAEGCVVRWTGPGPAHSGKPNRRVVVHNQTVRSARWAISTNMNWETFKAPNFALVQHC